MFTGWLNPSVIAIVCPVVIVPLEAPEATTDVITGGS